MYILRAISKEKPNETKISHSLTHSLNETYIELKIELRSFFSWPKSRCEILNMYGTHVSISVSQFYFIIIIIFSFARWLKIYEHMYAMIWFDSISNQILLQAKRSLIFTAAVAAVAAAFVVVVDVVVVGNFWCHVNICRHIVDDGRDRDETSK